MVTLRESDIKTRPCRYGLMSFFKNDTIISRSLADYGEWAQAEVEFLLSLIGPGDTVLDVGAFIGTHTLAFAERVGGGGEVYAFEPQPLLFEVLKRNIGQNLVSNVRLLNVALSDEIRQAHIHEIDARHSSNFAGTSIFDAASPTTDAAMRHVVNVTTLDQLAIERCDLIKIDAENMEINILQGSRLTLRSSRPVVFAECNSLQYGWPIVEFMKKEEYCIYLLNVPAYNPQNFRQRSANFLGDGREAGLVLVPAEQHSAIEDNLNQLRRHHLLIPISCLDDLALGLFRKPQYKDEVSSKGRGANVFGVGFWANQSEVERFRSEVAALQDQADQLRERVSALDEVKTRASAIRSQRDRLAQEVAQHQAMIQSQQEVLNQRGGEISRVNIDRMRATADLREKTSILNRIYDSYGWKARAAYYRLRNHLLPEGTWRRKVSKRFLHLILMLGRGLPKETQLFRTASATPSAREDEDLGRAYHHGQVSPNSQNVPLEDTRWIAPASTATSTMEDETKWQTYEILSKRITELRQYRSERLLVKPPTTVTIKENELSAHADSLIFQPADQVKVSIVIPVLNNLKSTLECLTSVRKHSEGVAYEIVVVDNGSSDQTPEVLSRVANIVYIRNETGLGLGHACNRGAASGRGEYILFLNNDLQVTDNWLKPLVGTFEMQGNVGAVGPKILFPDGCLREAGRLVNRDGTSTPFGLRDDPDLARYNYTREVMYCSGACLLVETKIFKKIGGFDISLDPGHCEDWDLAFRLREHGLRIIYNPTSVVIQHRNGKSSNMAEGSKMACVIRNQHELSVKWQGEIDNLNRIRLIALYLPQYHPIPENDRWWGKGFTEWTNVTKAQPNFTGHYQPHLPADLGFYDLRVEDILEKQAELAKRYGIYGFCYFYYWFAGKRLLEAPLDRMLRRKESVFPFCIAWANENWTRKWDGQDNEILIAQQHSDDDDRAVMRDMLRYLQHQNYIRINDKPLLIVYRVGLLPDSRRTTEIWRDLCRKEGLGDIYLIMAESFEHSLRCEHPSKYGFDAAMEYPPHGMHAAMKPPGKMLNPNYRGVVHDYPQVILKNLQKEIPGYVRFRTVMPSWDNTPRRQNDPFIFENAWPEAYQAWLEAILDQTHEQNFGDERIVFINAWNEWGEGNHLEPDRRFGHGFLEATRNAQDAWLLRRAKRLA